MDEDRKSFGGDDEPPPLLLPAIDVADITGDNGGEAVVFELVI